MSKADKFRAIVIEDEYPARLMIKQLSNNHTNLIELIGEAENVHEAIRQINATRPDLIFLDINLHSLNGFDLLSGIVQQPYIIFTTAYEQYAFRAFETNCVDYLLKPIEEKRFAQSMLKLQRFTKHNPAYPDLLQLKHLFSELQTTKKATAIPIKIGDKFIFIRLEDVAYLEAKDKYVYVVTIEGKRYLSDSRLNEFEVTLPESFIRIQKSFIVNKDHILEVNKHFGNRLVFAINDKANTRITSGITYIQSIRETLGL